MKLQLVALVVYIGKRHSPLGSELQGLRTPSMQSLYIKNLLLLNHKDHIVLNPQLTLTKVSQVMAHLHNLT